MAVIRAEDRFRRVLYRRCPQCRYVIGQAEVEAIIIDLPCPRCGWGRMSRFEPIRPNGSDGGWCCDDGGPKSA